MRKYIHFVILASLALTMSSGCTSILSASALPTLIPTEYIPTAIALTADALIAGAIGWTVRIVFTLVMGKEAFGTGDIHLMAATGCVAGWPVVLLGFFLTCGLALFGWVLSLPFKRTRAIPLGPWLSLSFLTVVLFYDSLIELPFVARTIAAASMLFLRNSQIGFIEVHP